MKRERCRVCSGPLPQGGRSRVYCSSSCRRLAEYELRRLNDHVTRLEQRLTDSLLLDAGLHIDGVVRPEDYRASLRAEIGRLIERQRVLMMVDEDSHEAARS